MVRVFSSTQLFTTSAWNPACILATASSPLPNGSFTRCTFGYCSVKDLMYAGAIAMILGQASGQTGVSGLDRLDERTVLQGGLIQRREHPLVQPQERPEHRHVPHEHLVDPRVAR